MKKIILISKLLLLSIIVFSQNTLEIYTKFKNDSINFRKLQDKKDFSSRITVFETGTGKQVLNAAGIQKKGAYTWVIKDSLKNIDLIVAIEGASSEEWRAYINVYSFDKSGKLNLIWQDSNSDYDISDKSQYWVADKYSQPCVFYLIGNNISVQKTYCTASDVFNGTEIFSKNGTSSKDISASSILKSFGVKNLMSK